MWGGRPEYGMGPQKCGVKALNMGWEPKEWGGNPKCGSGPIDVGQAL